ncbi:ammonium transporter [Cohaesibacter intestini]|uniref:ammonium transporter n=1 Tax=Cohaesibacter intestini TaxID=2211145 RepID=UPI000DEA6AD4|nr:ammonium transporter [Cohaesibacter intestini]
MRRILAISTLAFGSSIVTAEASALNVRDVESGLNMTWIMAASALIMFMQVGFLLLEAGMVRSKNSINVAQKNLLDFTFSVAAFAIAGFTIAFGSSHYGLIGFDWKYLGLQKITTYEAGFFVFQVMFCGTAATIVSGAVAERMRLSAYVIGSIFLSVLIYPVFVHWVWGNALQDNPGAFLANLGFIDFAGSTVVHATGAWVALAACLVLGAREGRFDEQGRPIRLAGHSPVLTAAGGLLLFIGWLGFNGGSTLKAGEGVAFIILNTILAGGFGAVAGHILGYLKDGCYLPEKSVNGMLGGLVAVTAGCAVLTPAGAIIIGAVGGAVAIYANDFLEQNYKIDDAVGAIGTHGFAGVVGTVGLAFLAPADQLSGSRLHQIYVQTGGALLNFCFCFFLGYAFFWTLNRVVGLRVNQKQELIGLNVAEHATRIGVGHVEEAMENLVSGQRGFSQRLPTVPGDEAEKLTDLFNQLMINMEHEHRKLSELDALKAQSEEAERITALSNATFEGIAMLKNGIIIDGNQRLVELLGYSLDEMVGKSVMRFRVKDKRRDASDAMHRGNRGFYEVNLAAKSGEHIPVAVKGRVINFRGDNVRIVCLVDLRERKAAERNMRILAQSDALTGLANRSLFNDKLDNAVKSASNGRSTALILVDLDRFKNVNDVHGHQAGDLVLKEAASRLQSIVGPDGTVARLGGDEFAIIQPNISFANQAEDTGHRIVAEMAKPISLGDSSSAMIGASVGVALCPEHARDKEDVFGNADIALYHSKNSGRSMATMYRQGLNELMEKRRLLQADLETALEAGEFEVYYQPRAEADNLEINSYEALLRWNHPVRGLVSPAEFIPVAEACGKIIDIDSWVFHQACLASKGPFAGKHISVNISPLQFQQKDFVAKIEAILAQTGAEPSQLELELTESMLIEDDARGLSIMKLLKSIGLSLALDDFGTGYSSLSYLSKYPFDTIKIDRSFVAALGQEDNAVAIMKAIISLGAGLGMKVVAEGVETKEEILFLRNQKCDQFQGYLIGKPVPIEQAITSAPADLTHFMTEQADLQETDAHVAALRALARAKAAAEDRVLDQADRPPLSDLAQRTA